jgi:glycosyltransferase involved in cell wall biosynthesis
MKELGDVDLLIVGEGPEKERLMTLTHEFGLGERVRFVGQVPQEELPMYYSAAEALVLASSREGWANVLLESIACGTPVIATDIEGNREVIQSPKAGVLVKERTSTGLACAIQGILADPPSRQETRAYAEKFSWEATTEGQLRLFEKILNRGQ